MRTTPLAKANEVDRKWYVIDAADVALGRVSSVVAAILRGKNKPTYTPNVDTGDNVIIINAAQVKLTGKKAKNKIYYSHSDHPGGLKSISAGQKRDEKPELFVEDSIRGMLPHNTLGRNQIKKLHVYAGSEHNHQAQNPEMLDINKLI
ncbi:50S ribosomal protein L13 [Companilactobacillus furfuricola]|uniref:50S ribosomal protein L13 n=1 Tax=Companilactobacillus furfuricola TaxID=1462575 RepID=UPI000F796F3D|nr:50S ribosomal protein L13 [Companilactobacillus furfuricola]